MLDICTIFHTNALNNTKPQQNSPNKYSTTIEPHESSLSCSFNNA